MVSSVLHRFIGGQITVWNHVLAVGSAAALAFAVLSLISSNL